jgi:hypothetical protein
LVFLPWQYIRQFQEKPAVKIPKIGKERKGICARHSEAKGASKIRQKEKGFVQEVQRANGASKIKHPKKKISLFFTYKWMVHCIS